jgi:spindle assembly abnormal protein 6
LFELEVGESDFADLRKDQALLVDFSDFSNSLISLLQCCELGDLQSHSVEKESKVQEHNAFGRNVTDDNYYSYGQPQHQHGPSGGSSMWESDDYTQTPSQGHHNQMKHQKQQYQRSPLPLALGKLNSAAPVSSYTCRLEADYNSSSDDVVQWRNGQNDVRSSKNARFSIVESNQFRELTHLALNLKTGTDKSVRQYLSSRLAQTMMQIGNVQSLYQDQQRRCEVAEKDLIGLNRRLQDLTHSLEAEKRHIQNQAAERLYAESNSCKAEVSRIKATKEAEIHELNEKAERSRELLDNKVRVLEDINKKINEEKLKSANENERLSTKLSIQEASNQSMTNELSTLRSQFQFLSDEKATTEKSLHQLQLQLASLEHSNSSHEKTITQTEAKRESAEIVSANAKETLSRQHAQMEDLRRRLSDAELAVSKYKDLTSRYQTNRLEMKKKMKEKIELMREQEQSFALKEREVNELKHSVHGLGDQLNDSKRKIESLEELMREKEQALKLKESEVDELKRRLENNQQVIAWLNKQNGSVPSSINAPLVGNPSSSSLSRYLPTRGFHVTPEPSLPQRLHPLPTPSIKRPQI